ncbi:MAG: hypothetical protein KGH54_03855 [Candidatus Micrarchaeota archaeon]|nr:hypothetical protein [Candidatus Micrarchaeota archaeon]
MDRIRTNTRKIDTYPKLLLSLILLELILSALLLLVSYLTANIYFKGVGIGLVIAWVTGAIAYLTVRKRSR